MAPLDHWTTCQSFVWCQMPCVFSTNDIHGEQQIIYNPLSSSSSCMQFKVQACALFTLLQYSMMCCVWKSGKVGNEYGRVETVGQKNQAGEDKGSGGSFQGSPPPSPIKETLVVCVCVCLCRLFLCSTG